MPRKGVPAGQTRETALALLEHEDGITTRDLCDVEKIGTASASKALSDLIAQGLVVKTDEKRERGAAVYRLVKATKPIPAASNGNSATPVSKIRNKRDLDTRVADALKVLFPKGLTNVDPLFLMQWIDMTKDMING